MDGTNQQRTGFALSLLLALALAVLYAHVRYDAWDDDLRSTTVFMLREQNRGEMWLQSAILADFGNFPAYSAPLDQRLQPLDGISLADFRIGTVDVAGLRIGRANPGDDLGLHYIGMLLHRLLGSDAIVVGMTWFAIILFAWCLFFFCFYAFQRGAYGGALLVALVFSLDPEVRKAADIREVWHPYAYVALMPLALYAVKQAGERLFDTEISGRSRSVVAALPQTILLLIHVAVVVCLLAIRSSAIVLVLPFLALLFVEWWWNRETRAATARALFVAALIGLSSYVGFIAPNAVVSRAFARQMSEHHVFWHIIWVSLGEYPNELQFKWSDSEAYERASALADHKIIFQSREYEEILKEDVLTTLQAHPDFLARVILQKLQYRLGPFLIALVIFGLSVALLRSSGGALAASGLARAIRLQFHPVPYVGLALLANRVNVLLSANFEMFYYPTLVAETLAIWVAPVIVCLAASTAAPGLANKILTRVGQSRNAAEGVPASGAPGSPS